MAKANMLLFRSLLPASTPRFQISTRYPTLHPAPWRASRWTSSTSTGLASLHQNVPSRPFWSTGRVLLFTAFASAFTYIYGVTDAGSHVEELWRREKSPKYGSITDLQKAISELRGLLGEDTISTDTEDLESHGFSEWSSINSEQFPAAVAFPKSTEEVSQIAKVCSKYRMPMVPYSGGSSLEGNFSAPHGGMTIDFVFMDKILQLHDDDMDVVVQPSIQWMQLNEQIKQSGLFFPVDPGPSAMIGGMVGTCCSGTNAVKYGTMKDWVINLTVVLADGRVIKTRRRPRKTSAGYNLTGLFVGAEGTLGIVTEVTLKLAVIPELTTVGVVSFPSMRHAASAALQAIRTNLPVQCMEIMDEVQMSVVNRAGGTNKTWKEVPTLFFKFAGTKAGVQDSVNVAKSIAKTNGGGNFQFSKDDAEMHSLWSARKEALWSMLSLRKGSEQIWSTDVAVPISRLPDIIEISKKEMDDLGLFASILGHIGDGNFHESILYDGNDPEERERVKDCVYRMVDRALEMEGTCTGEHGIGIGKKESLVKELGVDTIEVMRSLKRSLDPLWLMNPGKIFDATDIAHPRDSVKATAASTLDRPSSK